MPHARACLLVICLLAVSAPPVAAASSAPPRAPTGHAAGASGAANRFALNVFIKHYLMGQKVQYQWWTWHARCRVLRHRPEPTARCRLSWKTRSARWVARGSFRGAVAIGRGPDFREFRWRFRVTSTCRVSACDGRVRRHVWKGRGINTPA